MNAKEKLLPLMFGRTGAYNDKFHAILNRRDINEHC